METLRISLQSTDIVTTFNWLSDIFEAFVSVHFVHFIKVKVAETILLRATY